MNVLVSSLVTLGGVEGEGGVAVKPGVRMVGGEGVAEGAVIVYFTLFHIQWCVVVH